MFPWAREYGTNEGHAVLQALGITSNTLVRSSQSSCGPGGGDPMATGCDEELPARSCPEPPVYNYSSRGAPSDRSQSQDGSVRMSDHAQPPVPIGDGVTGGPESVWVHYVMDERQTELI